MLTRKDVGLASDAILAAEGRLDVKVRPGTPLALLMDVSVDSNGEDITGHIATTGVNVHDEVMASVIAQGEAYLQQSMFRARSVVLPICNDLVDAIQGEVTKRVIKQTELTIVKTNFAELMNVPSFMSMVQTEMVYDELIRRPLPINALPPIRFEDVMDKLKVGVANIDEAGSEFLNPTFTSYVWSVITGNVAVDIDRFISEMGPSFAVGAFYVLECILRNEQQLDITISDAVRLYIKAVCAFLASRIRILDSRRQRGIELGRLITAVGGKTIYVNGDTYNAYLKAGGSPEVIMGASFEGVPRTRSEIESRADTYLEAYDKYVRSNQTQVKSMRSEAIRVVMPTLFYDYIRTEEKYKDSLIELRECINDKMNMVAINENDIYPSVRQLVCSVLYPKADTLKVLSRIDELLKANPDMDQADAATACYTSLLTDFMFSQLIVTDC